jgi:hypothetical protein
MESTMGEQAMTRTLLLAVVLLAGVGFAVAQDKVPGNKSEAASPAPSLQQKAPPDKVAPGSLISPNALTPDDKAEGKTPPLKMDSATDTKLPSEGTTSGQETARPPPR